MQFLTAVFCLFGVFINSSRLHKPFSWVPLFVISIFCYISMNNYFNFFSNISEFDAPIFCSVWLQRYYLRIHRTHRIFFNIVNADSFYYFKHFSFAWFFQIFHLWHCYNCYVIIDLIFCWFYLSQDFFCDFYSVYAFRICLSFPTICKNLKIELLILISREILCGLSVAVVILWLKNR